MGYLRCVNQEKWYSKDDFHDFSNGKLDDEYTTKRSSVEVKINGKYSYMQYQQRYTHFPLTVELMAFPKPPRDHQRFASVGIES